MMKILRIILLILIVLLTNIGLAGLYRQRNLDGYLAAFLDKQHLLETTPSPKVILVGGSNVAFGFRSEMIEETLGMPVVNMGLQGALGIRFLLKSIAPFVAAGDIILIAPEYENFFLGFKGGDTLLQLLLLSPQSVKYISSLDVIGKLTVAAPAVHTAGVKNLLLDKVFHCRTCFKDEEVYRRDAFDQNGDYAHNAGVYKADLPAFKIEPAPGRTYSQEIGWLNAFSNLAESRQATVYFVYPSTNVISDESTLQNLQMLDATLVSNLKFPILGKPINYQFRDDEMFNTWYHLNQDGAESNTRNVLSRMCASMPDLCH